MPLFSFGPDDLAGIVAALKTAFWCGVICTALVGGGLVADRLGAWLKRHKHFGSV